MLENNPKRIYLDYAATTPVDERVGEAIQLCARNYWGNASSLHHFGAETKEQLQHCRAQIAATINADPEEIIFTSGGTEANNMALKGMAFANKDKGHHIIVSAIEHDCILETCKWLATQGFFITYLPVDHNGFVDLEHLKKCINAKTILVSIMHANNEIGTIEPIQEIGAICKNAGVVFHTDACQTFGKIPINVKQDNIALMSLNAHKIYGGKGVGALYVKKGTTLTPLLHGGGQEFGLRATTENLPAITGFAVAAEICMAEMEQENIRIAALRKHAIHCLSEHFEGFYLNGDTEKRLANNLNFSIAGLEGEAIRILLLLDKAGFAVSTGSACSNNDSAKSASHVLQAIGKDPFQARGAIRVSTGRFTSQQDMDNFIDAFVQVAQKLTPIFSSI